MLNPISANALEFAKQMLEIHGRIRASHFAGVRDALFQGEQDASEVAYEITGERVRNNRFGLRLTLTGELNLLCQRCLGEMKYPLNHTAVFEVVANETKVPDDMSDDDEIDYLVADAELNVEQLIGQELLLGLPLAPKHENALCSSAKEVDTDEKPNPFSVLQGLKRNT
ncbi:MAG TPA: YceD family protein [Methylophilaceae bacterium]